MRVLAVLILVGAACGARTDLGGKHAGGGPDASAGDAGCVSEIVAQDPKGATALAVEPGDTVFWGTQDGAVKMRDPSGTTTVLAQESDAISSITFDDQYVYYALTGRIRRVPRGGGSASDVGTNLGQPFALALSSFPSKGPEELYYVDYGAGIAAGSVHVRPKDGSGNDTVVIKGIDTPGGLAVDHDYVYLPAAFADIDGLTYQGPLFRIQKNGLSRSTLTSNLEQPSSLVVYDANVYFVEQTGAGGLHGGVRQMPVSGGPPKTALHTDGMLPLDVAVDSSGVYATALEQPMTGFLLQTGSPTTLASTAGVEYAMVRTSPTAIYWTIGWTGSAPSDGASVRKLCK